MSTPLRSAIKKRIEAEGPIPFTEFMETALYHPKHGYYTSGRPVWGAEGDYVTSLDVSPVFAIVAARQIYEMWERLGSPGEFTLVDAGAGRGLLTCGILATAKERYPALFRALRPVMTDAAIGAPGRSGSNEADAGFAKEIERYASLDRVEPFDAGVIISNELLDALPFHRVLMGQDGLKEVYTGLKEGEFADVTGEPSTPELEEYFKRLDITLVEGQRAEVSLKALLWIGRAAELIRRGFVITIDYGLPARELYAPGRQGTLLCHHRHTINDAPYERVGEQDITAHVDFTSIRDAGLEAGLKTIGFATQLHFLLGLGILGELIEVGDEKAPGIADAIRHNQGIKRLIMPGQMGDTFKVLIQCKGISAPTLSGLSFKNSIGYL